MKIIIQLLLVLSLIGVCYSAQNSQDLQYINKTIEKGKQNIWERHEDDHFNYPTYLGRMFLSWYHFEVKALGLQNYTKFNPSIHAENILKDQLPDGSWQQLEEENEDTSCIDAAIAHYYFLKSYGLSIEDERMVKARKWILSQGGVEGAQQITRFKLSMMGQYNWEETIYIPLFIFDKDFFLSRFTFIKDIVAQWVYPHLTAFAYLRYFRYFQKADDTEIFELWVNPPANNDLGLSVRESGNEPEEIIEKLVDEIFSVWRPRGSFGTYTVSTVFNMMSLKHFMESFPNHHYVPKIQQAMIKGIQFCEMNLFNKISPYTGQLDDGRWWDTILVSWALLEAGEEPKKLESTADKVIADALQDNGGIAYGWEFEYYPDSDDTALFVTFLAMLNNLEKYQYPLDRASSFVKNFQNADGGYAAFDVDRQGNWLYDMAFKIARITCSAEIFDPSCVDITGHMFESFGLLGRNISDPHIQKSIKFIENNYHTFEEGKYIAWEARWGINYIYSSGALIPGLAKIGYDLNNELISKNILWLKDRQNKDGGWGETTNCYKDPVKFNGKGTSTPTMTAWALLALLEVTEIYDVKEHIERGIDYLLKEFWGYEDGKWYDASVVGTGHRAVIYLQYPAYSQAFPLIAMSRYRDLLEKGTPFAGSLKTNNNKHKHSKSEL